MSLRKNAARLAEPLRLVHPVTIAHASGTTPTPITNRQHHHGDGDDHHHDVYEDERGIFPCPLRTRFTNIRESSEYYRRRGCDCGRLSVCQRRKVMKVTMADRYKNFLELAKKETQGIDFRVRLQQRAGNRESPFPQLLKQ